MDGRVDLSEVVGRVAARVGADVAVLPPSLHDADAAVAGDRAAVLHPDVHDGVDAVRRASALIPLLRPGGRYVLAGEPDALGAAAGELVLSTVADPGMVEEVAVVDGLVLVRRGSSGGDRAVRRLADPRPATTVDEEVDEEESPGDAAGVHWQGRDRLSVGGVTFDLFERGRDSDGDMFLFKSARLIRAYLELAPELRGARLVELGIFRGGSTAFFSELLRPERLVAVERAPECPGTLARYLDSSPHAARISCHFGVDQADGARLGALVDAEVHGPLDAVVDDASHLPGPTEASFDVLLPRVRPRGLFVIEDWSHGIHRRFGGAASVDGADDEMIGRFLEAAARSREVLERLWVASPDEVSEALRAEPGLRRRLAGSHPGLVERIAAGERPPDDVIVAHAGDLTPLVQRLCRLCIEHPGVAAELSVRVGMAVLRRGDRDLDRDAFRLADLC